MESESMKMTDGQKKIVVSDTILTVFLIVSACILVLVGILYFNKVYVEFLNNVEPWIECFVGVFIVAQLSRQKSEIFIMN